MIKAEIVSVGREVLRGFTINTNASWLAQQLTSLGIEVKRITVVDDEEIDIIKITKEVLERKPQIVIYTGGLGPTFDDITVESVSKALNLPIELNEDALNMIKKVYNKLGLPLTEERIKMAKMPKGSLPLPNSVGTAPGVFLIFNETIIIMLPGVPEEMKSIFTESVRPRLIELKDRGVYLEKIFKVHGIPESEAAKVVKDVKKQFKIVYIKSHPRGYMEGKPTILFQLSYLGEDQKNAKIELENVMRELISRLSNLGAKIEVEQE
ncbi:MAG: nicotinamide mononucleotide deamidase-related protein [Thermoprotei archaeon]|jgi:molybdenum cofactor synthesis domain-containing protein